MDFWHRGAWNSAEIQIFGGFFGVISCSFGGVGKGRVVLELGFFGNVTQELKFPRDFPLPSPSKETNPALVVGIVLLRKEKTVKLSREHRSID